MMDYSSFSHFRSIEEFQTGALIRRIFPPFLVLLGTAGCVLSIIVLTRKRFSGRSTSVYLIGLAVSDLFMLYTGVLKLWLEELTGVQLSAVSLAMCRADRYVSMAASHTSTWILVAITLERLVSIYKPVRSRTLCSKVNAMVVLAGICIASFVWNLIFMFSFGNRHVTVKNTSFISYCDRINNVYGEFLADVWVFIDFIGLFLLPFLILGTGNTLIIWKARQSHRRSQRQIAPQQTQDSSTPSYQRMVAMSKVLCLLNVVFIVCSTPICVYYIGWEAWVPADVPLDVQGSDPYFALAYLLYYCNNATNFLLYCVSGTIFRQELKKLFHCGKFVNGQPSSM